MGRDTEVLVVGGGSTGCGVARDLAMRGVDVTLVERGRLTDGTTGRMHGLLHSGARYAVSDRESARECIRENEILREIAGHCIDDTGGLFVQRPADSDEYFEEKLRGCAACGVPARELTAREARSVEPLLASDVERAIEVPDAAVDPFRCCAATALDAARLGARIETQAAVVDVLREGDDVTGVAVHHRDGIGSGPHDTAGTGHGAGDVRTITAEYVVNAAGAWAGQLAAMADLPVSVRPSKGAMVTVDAERLDTVINRCRPKGEADIVVPQGRTAVLGTTDDDVDDPDDFVEDPREVEFVIDELADLVPSLADARVVGSYWGVRPLYDPPETDSADTTEVTRRFFVLDHEAQDGVSGLVSAVGGKFTIHRSMAERIADHVCEKLGVAATCSTADEPLPGSERPDVLDAAMDDFGLREAAARHGRD